MKEYEEWKKQPEHYFQNQLDITDQNGRVITRITHKEFAEEKKTNFQNWKQNKKAILMEKDGKMVTSWGCFFEDKGMEEEWLKKLIAKCEEMWRGQPKHFLDIQKEWIEEKKKQYANNVKQVKEKSAAILKKYEYLIPVFRSLNQDVFT